MNKIFLLISATFLFLGLAQAGPTTPPAPVVAPAPQPVPAAPVSKVPLNISDIVDAFAQKKLDIKKDLPETKKMVEYLLALDDEDPSRTEVMALSLSYNRYPRIYDQAILEVSKKKNKEQREQLKEIRALLRDFNRNGNG